MRRGIFHACLGLAILAMSGIAGMAQGRELDVAKEPVFIRAQNLPTATQMNPSAIARRAVIRRFQEQHPNYTIEAFAMPAVQTSSAGDTGPLMAIAAGMPPHAIYVNFRQSSTYIEQGFLEPMEILLARLHSENPLVRSVDEKDQWLANPTAQEIAAALAEIRARVAEPVWPVVYRPQEGQAEDKQPHVWSLPIANLVRGLIYRKDYFYEAGLDPDRPPQTWDEMMDYCRKLTEPSKGRFGLVVRAGDENSSWGMYSFIVSTDARAVVRDEHGEWKAGFGTRGFAEAVYFLWRLAHEPFEKDGQIINGCMKLASASEWAFVFPRGQAAMMFQYLSDEVLSDLNPQLYGLAPVPYSPFGTRGSEVNCQMLGVFSDSTKLQQLAVMNLIWYFTGDEAQEIRTRVYVESGLGQFVSPQLLEKFGYDRLLRRVPKGWQEAFNEAMTSGVPEPYGRNTQNIYRYMSEPLNVGLEMPLGAMPREQAIDQLYALAVAAAQRVDIEVLGTLPETEMVKRRIVAGVALVVLMGLFGWMISSIWRYFTKVSKPFNENRSLRRFVWGYLLLMPGLLLVMWWQYIPLAAGLSISFMDFRLVQKSTFQGLDNFAMVLFDARFWWALSRTLYWVALLIGLGFWPPILLAILLQEVPTTSLKYFYRTIFYLPHVLAGVVVYFLWNQLYDPSENGVLNQLLMSLNHLGPIPATLVKLVGLGLWVSLIAALAAAPIKIDEMPRPLKLVLWAAAALFMGLTFLPVIRAMNAGGAGAAMGMVANLWGQFDITPLRWTRSPDTAMLCVVIPAVWASAGPGCILYLAALKTVPDELYEAADIDGASNWHKVFYIVLPRLKYLIMIQFIAAVIAAFKGGTEYVLVMTGGGPNDATKLLSLEIFIRTFLELRYGIGTAMAWLLGGLLIGFTAYQLRLLSNAEFRASGSGA